MAAITIEGYRRGLNRIGVRNHVVVMAGVACANSIVERIARTDDTIIPITHQHGCTHMGEDREQVLRTLSGTCDNPNVGGVLLVGLGCETIGVDEIASRIDREGKIVKTLVIQEIGEIHRIVETAAANLREIKAFARKRQRVDCDVSQLVVGLECGGSDPFSGITANPAVGIVSERLVALGATVILSEIPEMIGAEDILKRRIADEGAGERLFARVQDYVQAAKSCGCDLRGGNPSPGNIKAGLSSIEEKSIGCIIKGGRCAIGEFVRYAETPGGRGLVVMDTPGNDPESVTGMVAGGANVVLFTTGVGTPLGHPVAPVIKIASNTKTFERMRDFMDIDAGRTIEGTSIEDVADAIFTLLLEVCNGRETAAEVNRCREFAVNWLGPTF